MCSNDECLQVVNRRDKELHETKMCDFRTVKCDYCGEEIQFIKIKSHTCPTRREIDEIKLALSEVKDKLNHMCCAQDEMAKEMRSMMSDLKESMTNSIKQAMATMQSSCHVSTLHPANKNEDIVIAGGEKTGRRKCKSVEIFSWTNNSWIFMGEMNQCRSAATSFVYDSHMIATGGFSDVAGNDSMEKMDLTEKNGQWIDSPVKLPFKCRGHKTVLDHNRLIVIGGMDDKSASKDTIYEILLTHPYSSKLLTCTPLPRIFHGAERICDRIYILGGRTSGGQNTTDNAVLMYDLVTNRCQMMAPLPFSVCSMATVSWKDTVIVIGGVDENGKALNTVTMYNVNTEKSTMLPEMKKKRKGCAAVVTGNKIVVMGGRDQRDISLNSVECYSFDTNLWEDLPPMLESRLYPTAVVKPACIDKE